MPPSPPHIFTGIRQFRLRRRSVGSSIGTRHSKLDTICEKSLFSRFKTTKACSRHELTDWLGTISKELQVTRSLHSLQFLAVREHDLPLRSRNINTKAYGAWDRCNKLLISDWIVQ